MSSGYYYKGIDLSNIYVNDGLLNDSIGFKIPVSKGNYLDYSGMRPISFGYTVSGVDLCNTTTANYDVYTDTSKTTNVVVPSGVKSCRVISVGGSGGGGGCGGNASAKEYLTSKSSGSFGGDGGMGGYGAYKYSTINLDSVSTIQVVVGSAGTGGTAGNSNSTHMNVTELTLSKNTSGGDGNSGNAGNLSYIYFDNNSNTHYAVSGGGNGGEGGYGANAKATYAAANSKEGDGGTAGNASETQANDTNYPPVISYTVKKRMPIIDIKGTVTKYVDVDVPYYAGVPSTTVAQAYNSDANGYKGTDGAVQIIWLYD